MLAISRCVTTFACRQSSIQIIMVDKNVFHSEIAFLITNGIVNHRNIINYTGVLIAVSTCNMAYAGTNDSAEVCDYNDTSCEHDDVVVFFTTSGHLLGVASIVLNVIFLFAMRFVDDRSTVYHQLMQANIYSLIVCISMPPAYHFVVQYLPSSDSISNVFWLFKNTNRRVRCIFRDVMCFVGSN